MTDIIFPPDLFPRKVTWTLARNIAEPRSPLSGTTQRWTRAGAKWRASIEMPPLDQFETGLLAAWLDQISRGDNVGIVPVYQNDRSGTDSDRAEFANQQLKWHLSGAFTSWTAFNLLQAPLLTERNISVVANGATGVGAQARYARTFTVLPNVPYTVIVDVPLQVTPGGMTISNGSGGALYYDSRSAPVTGRIVVPVTSDDAGLQVQLYPANGQTNFALSVWGNVQVMRSYLVQASAAAGAQALQLIGSDFAAGVNPARVTNLMRTLRNGQYVTLRAASGAVELKRVQMEVTTIGGATIGGVAVGHLGRTVFEPALRNALAVNDRIITDTPWCRMRLATPESSGTIDAPMFGGFAFDLIEEFGA